MAIVEVVLKCCRNVGFCREPIYGLHYGMRMSNQDIEHIIDGLKRERERESHAAFKRVAKLVSQDLFGTKPCGFSVRIDWLYMCEKGFEHIYFQDFTEQREEQNTSVIWGDFRGPFLIGTMLASTYLLGKSPCFTDLRHRIVRRYANSFQNSFMTRRQMLSGTHTLCTCSSSRLVWIVLQTLHTVKNGRF